ncbi:MAG: HPr(Ser) kinase/phosphatase [Clostridiaceae bacterium]
MVTVAELIRDLKLEIIVEGKNDSLIAVSETNRPGLQIAGFYNYFAKERVQVLGLAEWSFLDAMQPELRKKRVGKFFKYDFPCLVISRGINPHEQLIEAAKATESWILRTDMVTTRFINKAMYYLDEKLAPEVRLHGVLVDVYGIGMLITGDSGIGKSETALELIKRGHRLVADDAVDIKEVDGVLTGVSPFITNGMLEVRGMGIIDVPALYGISSTLSSKTIDMAIYLENWKGEGDYDRLGSDNEKMNIVGVDVKKITLPIRPGRNLAVIIEAAAVNYRYSLTSDVSPIEKLNMRIESYNANK